MKYKIMAVIADSIEQSTNYRNLERDLAVEIAKRLTKMMKGKCYFYPKPEN